MKPFFLSGCLLVSLTFAGCQVSEHVVTLKLNKMNSEAESTGPELVVAVSSFDDQRPETDHLGVHVHHGGEKTYFDIENGNVSPHVTDSFIDFLNNEPGFSAEAAQKVQSPDVTIDAVLKTFTVKATDYWVTSSLEVDVVMEFTIHNATDESTVRVTSASGGTNEDFIYDKKEYLEELMTKALNEGFVQLLEETKIQGKALRRRG